MSETAVPTASTGENDRARRARADRISGLILAALMLAVFGLVLRTIITIATGPLLAAPGGPAPAFASVTPEGTAITLDAHKDRVVLVDFWATWCPPCVQSMPTLEKLYADYKDRGFVVLGVNQEAGEEAHVRAFANRLKLTFPIVMDSGLIARDYGVFTFPTTFLLARDGTIRGIYRGVAQESQLRRAIEEQLSPGAKN